MRQSATLLLIILSNAWGVGVTAQSDETRVKRGAEVYRAQKCQACHSIAGVGNRRYPLDGVGSKLTEEDIRKWIVAPRDMNPKVSKRAYDKLPKADLEALVAFLKSLRKPLAALARQEQRAPVEQVMRRDFLVADASDMLDITFQRLQATRATPSRLSTAATSWGGSRWTTWANS